MTGRLAGKVALITGGGAGLGRGMVEQFAVEGASVVFLEICADWSAEVEQAATSAGHVVHGIVGDVTNADDVRRAVACCRAIGNRVDILVNNAGVATAGQADLLDMPLDEWRRVMAVNLDGPLLCIREAGRLMKEIGGGSIINMTSIAAHSCYPRSGAYSVSKAALEALTRQAAVELGPYNIRVNAMSLGWFRTALNEHVYQQPGQLARRNATIPLRRIGSVEDCAKLAIFLASEDSAYITGESFEADGGLRASSLSHSVDLARVRPLAE